MNSKDLLREHLILNRTLSETARLIDSLVNQVNTEDIVYKLDELTATLNLKNKTILNALKGLNLPKLEEHDVLQFISEKTFLNSWTITECHDIPNIKKIVKIESPKATLLGFPSEFDFIFHNGYSEITSHYINHQQRYKIIDNEDFFKVLLDIINGVN